MKQFNPGWLKRSLRVPLGVKLLITSSLAAALAIAATLFIVGNVLLRNARTELSVSTSTLARALASTLEAPLAFHAENEVKRTLQMYSHVSSVRAIAVFSAKGEKVSSVGATKVIPSRLEDSKSLARKHCVVAQVKLQGETVGYVCVIPNDDRIVALKESLFRLGFSVGIVALLLSAVLAGPLIRHITTNVRLLSDAAERIARKEGLGIHVHKRGNDETGDLIDRFNEMVQELRTREHELRSINEQLEKRVAERTAELKSEVEARRAAQEALEAQNVFLQLLNDLHQLVYQAPTEEHAAQSVAQALLNAFRANVVLVECYEQVPGRSTWKGVAGIPATQGLSCPSYATPSDGVRRTGQSLVLHGQESVHLGNIPHKDEIPVETYIGVPLVNGKGECVGVLSLFFDERLDEQKTSDIVSSLEVLSVHAMAEVERRRQEAEISFLAQFPEKNPSPVLRCSSAGKVLYANPAARPFLNEWQTAVDAPLPWELAEVCEEVNAEGERRQIEMSFGGRDYLFTFAPVEGSDYVHVYTADISILKEAERQAAEARDRALEIARLKSEFLANMSHEIRTPMNGVLGMAELLLSTDLNSEQRDFVETIHSSGNALLAIVNDILDFSKIDAGRMTLHPAPAVPSRIAEEVCGLLSATASAKGIELIVSIDTNRNHTVLADEVRLRQVLTNLVGNAVKFTSEGEVVLRMQALSESDDNIRLRFEVSDTGPGIAPDQLDIIFDPFRQADGSMTRAHGGTGLGLSISRQLVELMGGTMGVNSKLGEGSTFWFEVEFEKAKGVTPGFTPAPEELQEKRILIVDDNGTNRLILARSVESWGMIPTVANSGPEALQLLTDKSGNFDAIIVDGQMPQMSGEDLAVRIRELEAHKRTPIVLLSSAGSAVVSGGHANLFDFVLTKPVRRSQLFDVLANVFGSRIADAATRSGGRGSEQVPSTCSGTILLAEDNPVNRKVAVRLLEKMGFTVICAANGREAVDTVMQQDVDLVLMDVQMPEMDGFTATAAIRDWQAQSGVAFPIIAMTAHALEGDRERCIEAGMDDYISKPISQDRLRRVLLRWLPGSEEEAA